MARPLTPAAFLAALDAEGVRLCTHCRATDWTSNTRGPFAAEVHGIVNHHTASNTTPTELIRDGRPDLSGPLSISHMTRDSLIHLVGWGRCNHAGKCDGRVLDAIAAGKKPPRPQTDTLNFNPVTYSIEVNGTNDGQPFTPDMIDNLTRYNTALCRAHQWNANHAVGHSESTTRKPGDPSGISMDALRQQIAERLGAARPTNNLIGRLTGRVTVRRGMTLGAIATAAGVTITALLAANPQITNPDRIEPGQVLIIPTVAPQVPPQPPKAPPAYNPGVTGHPHDEPPLEQAQTIGTADLQGHLNAWRANRALSVHTGPPGAFDTWTVVALRTFQERNGLPVTGKVSGRDWVVLHKVTRGSVR